MEQQLVQRECSSLPEVFCFLTDFALLILGIQGLVLGFFSAFDFPVYVWAVYVFTGILTLFAALFFSIRIPKKYKQYTYGAGVFVVFLFVLTNGGFIKNGFLDCARGLISSFNIRYQSQVLIQEQILGKRELTVFFILVIFVLILVLSYATIVRADLMPIFLIEFPVLMMVLMMGRHVNGVALLFIILHFVGCMAQEYALKNRNERSHLDDVEEERNRKCLCSVQKKAALISGGVVLVSICISLYLLMPLLPNKIPLMQRWGAALQKRVVSVAVEYLPIITSGKWNLRVQTVGGGVEDGGLGEVAGYSLTNMDDLIVASTIEPKETIYLRGYVGSIYKGDRWAEPSQKSFENASVYWHTKGNAGIYVQNLPFLQQMYQENKIGESSAMGILSVENVNAGDKYTFLPYCSYLNDYYQIADGDGSVMSQTQAKDEFAYFPLGFYVETMQGRSVSEEEGILDRVEAEYYAYVKQNYLIVPEGFEELKKQCEEEHIRQEDIEKIVRYVTTFLVSNYEYNIEVPRLPKDKDFIQYFLYESKEGYSAHFASAAVIMFRMFGVPSRYVTGYAAPETIFSMDVSGNYTALLQSDNSHAWAEIYMEGIGWVPVETTPGNIGVLQTIYGEEEQEEEQTEEQTDASEAAEEEVTEEEEEKIRQEQQKYTKIRWYLGGVILLLFGVILSVLLIRRVRYERRRRGYDKKEEPNERLVSLFCMLHETLQRAGMPKEIRSTSLEFSHWLQKVVPDITSGKVELVVRMTLAAAYGEKQVEEKEIRFLRDIYKQCRKAVRSGKRRKR